ncbi:MAG: riboflavin synthase [Candidatus Cloacimonetes bacterium]|nr:riboflavin synthase [Candidatus Cloacimonadota bacterium]
MFTGIIEEIGKLESYLDKGGKRYLNIGCSRIIESLKIGDSVCCNGACLTVTAFNNRQITVEVMGETLSKTTVSSWKPAEKINLEPALPASGRFDGHIVQGHVDCVSEFISQEQIAETTYLWYKLAAEHQDMVTWQGSIAVNGVSLTIAKLEKDRFAVALITHTLQETNLVEPGRYVNLEFDIIGKYIVRYFSNHQNPKMTMEWLREKGF